MSTIVRRFCTQSTDLWKPALHLANSKLASRNIEVNVAEHLPLAPHLYEKGYRHLEIREGKNRELIDIFKIPSDRTQLLESVHRLVAKIFQHLQAKTTAGILISPYGRKVDVRGLSNCRIEMDKEGRLWADGRRIEVDFVSRSAQQGDKAPLSSCTMIRADEHPKRGAIDFFDDEDALPHATSQIAVLENYNRFPTLRLSRPGEIDELRRIHFGKVLKSRVP